MTFRVGQRVVCVDDKPSFNGFIVKAAYPVLGRVYTIRDIYPYDEYGPPHLTLIEVRNAIAPTDNREYAFGFHRFRPAVEPKQEVSFTTGAPIDSERWDNRRRVVEPMPVDGWRVSVKT